MRAAVRRQIEAMPEKYVRCKAVGHVWDEIDESQLGVRTRRKQITNAWGRWFWRCVRCDSAKIEVWAWSGEVTSRQYRPSKGYRGPRGVGRSRSVWRAELIRRRQSKFRPRRAAAQKRRAA
jgi:hypothetical protein